MLDLGSGTGKICFIAAQVVGMEGRVIGIDMANDLRTKQPLVAADSIDVVVSNCVLNLVEAEEKPALFRELFRVLRTGGRGERMAVCDKTFQLLQSGPYAKDFAFISPAEPERFAEEQPFTCKTDARRHPRETKGGEGTSGRVKVTECRDGQCC